LEIVIGIDPGSQFTGYGIVTEIDGRLRCLAFGVVEASLKDTFSKRLLTIGQGLNEIIDLHKPTVMAIEKTFFSINADSAIKLGQARGVCLYEGARFGLEIFEYNPTEIKSSIVGNGRAPKDQVQFLVCALLGLPAMGKFDMSDALALAIHHTRVSATKIKLENNVIRMKPKKFSENEK
jgi:crossover junction endodeoxyribonuclease RuvC